ncbi:SGNH/GDSL hydrolase family protein [Arthrobacter sp. StoSoilB5]|uniref:SGNH/GDSL hydrolase family protein n=1 Tax=Arthrobacter sp. StoSoilB5 TaxID=2830992 RepID=UPI001CC3DACE|nr:SGNH/GDSL hydrolase family protein [Arthrobacter sp. StoSoilB5]BCW46636.1 hypothetical protein StoSoilB5_38200 [Arthrobacter sp. StoSoilB5]
MKRIALALVAAALLTGCTPSAAPSDPDIQKKADAYGQQVQDKMKADAEAAAEARIIKLAFPKDRPLSVFYAADSLSYSLYSSTEDKGYRPMLNAELRKHGEIKEQRATKADANALFKAGNVLSVPDSGIDLAILELGTNDTQRTPVDQFNKDYSNLVRNVKRSPNVQMICVGAWGGGGQAITDPYDFEIQKVCEANGGQYVDLTKSYERKDTWGPDKTPTWLGPSDNFHPNDKGHKEILDLILERIRIV